MKYGFVLPFADVHMAVQLGYEAEQSGWDGYFVWESVWGLDAWVLLTAIAMRTERIRIGTLLSPLSRMRPWKLASETVTLDHLSHGRVILSVGLGALDTGFEAFGEVTDRKTRAELMDEGLDILTGLWRGQPFSYAGKHYQVQESTFSPPPPPVQQPRIPIWVVGAWPRTQSMQRALRYDGLLPMVLDENGKVRSTTPADIQAMRAFIDQHRTETTPFDIIMEGTTSGDNPVQDADTIRPWIEAGATWWIESMWDTLNKPNALELVRQRIAQGPPHVA